MTDSGDKSVSNPITTIKKKTKYRPTVILVMIGSMMDKSEMSFHKHKVLLCITLYYNALFCVTLCYLSLNLNNFG